MQRKLTYVSTACFCLFAIALFLTVELQSMVLAYAAMVFFFLGCFVSLFGIIGPILFPHVSQRAKRATEESNEGESDYSLHGSSWIEWKRKLQVATLSEESLNGEECFGLSAGR